MRRGIGWRRQGCTRRIVPPLMAVTLCAATLCAACAPLQVNDERITVAVTLLPQAEFVEAVGGDRVQTVVMVPPGASPHTYEPTPNQMVALSRAEMYAMVGTPVEFELVWMPRLVQANRDMHVVDCSRGIDLIDSGDMHELDSDHAGAAGDAHNHTGSDPHIWLSVRNARLMVENICAGLVLLDPANEEYYRANCSNYLSELTRLDEELHVVLKPLDGKSFIVFHPSFGYFARDYSLVQLAVEQGGGEPDAQYIVRLIQAAKQSGIRVVFVAPQVSARSAEVIAAEIGGVVVVIDPLAKDYILNMRAIAQAMLQVR